jgi:methylenetetrahydrofolate reductase (NADPH)
VVRPPRRAGRLQPRAALDKAAATLTDPASAVEGLHLFTFNQVRQTEQWRSALVERLSAGAAR